MSIDGRPRDREMIAVLATTVAVLVAFGFDLLPYRVLGAAGATVSLALDVWAADLSRRIAALPTTSRANRRFWRVVAVSALCFGLANTVALVLSARDPGTVARAEPPAQMVF